MFCFLLGVDLVFWCPVWRLPQHIGGICSTIICTGHWVGQMCSLGDDIDKRRDYSRATDTGTASKPRTRPWQMNAVGPAWRVLCDKNVWAEQGTVGSRHFSPRWTRGTGYLSPRLSLSQSRAYKMDGLLPPLTQMNYFKHFLLSCQMEVLSVWVWGAYDGDRKRTWKYWGCLKPSDCFLSVHFLFKGIVCALHSLLRSLWGVREKEGEGCCRQHLSWSSGHRVCGLRGGHIPRIQFHNHSLSEPMCLYAGRREWEGRGGREGPDGSYIRQRASRHKALLTPSAPASEYSFEKLFASFLIARP